MIMRVTEEGLLIPKEMLKGVDQVEVRQENHHLLIVPLVDKDPIFELGEHPVVCDAPDASTSHDQYIYGPRG